ncbi:hypothetical protein [Persicitalea sp.]|uniref:hypothetical protein n=1 Tax=Persicitalea sp. TaxID=3100273 RepID=UPI003593622C
MNRRLALVLSVALHPLLLPTYIFGLLFGLAPELVGVIALSPSARVSLLVLLFMNTFVVPALVIYYMYRLGFVRSLQLQTLRDRRLPYLATILIYSVSIYLFGWQFQPIGELAPQVAVILASITVSLVFVAVISLNWQISAHATGMGGCLGALGGVILRFGDFGLFIPLVLSVIATGFLLSARLRLDAHTPAQVSAGLGLGVVISMSAVFLFF